jgi:drug/metabolite transporter (DMT)-like permease
MRDGNPAHKTVAPVGKSRAIEKFLFMAAGLALLMRKLLLAKFEHFLYHLHGYIFPEWGTVDRLGILQRLQSHIEADLWLLLASLIWGTSFPLVKMALFDVSPLLFLAVRFSLGALCILPFLIVKKRRITPDRFWRGGVLGLFMFLGMMLQTLGLQYTTASKSGFLTGLCVVFVPFLVVLIEKRMPRLISLIGVVLAVAGIFFLTDPRGGGFNKGDLLTLLCAVSFAFQILFVEMLVKKDESDILAFLMVAATAILAGMSCMFLEVVRFNPSARGVGALCFTAVFCTAIGFHMQIRWQPRTTATAAAVIYTTEPVFAVVFAFMILDERLTSAAWIGAGLIFLGMILAEFRK